MTAASHGVGITAIPTHLDGLSAYRGLHLMPPCEQMAYQKTKPHAHTPAQVHTVEVHTFRFSNKTILPNCPWHVAERQDKEQEAERRRQAIKHPRWPAQPTALDNELRPLVWPQRS